jgi:hypothetical protein
MQFSGWMFEEDLKNHERWPRIRLYYCDQRGEALSELQAWQRSLALRKSSVQPP